MADNSPSESEVRELVEQYKSEQNWEELRSAANQTSRVIRDLAESIVEQGNANTETMTVLHRLCQHENQYSADSKISDIRELDLPNEKKEELESQISESVGSVGGTGFHLQVPEEYEDDTLELLQILVTETDRDALDSAIENYANLGISGIQSGMISPIFHYLHPEKYPVVNARSREGMETYFGRDPSGQLDNYLSVVSTFEDVRDEYGFNQHYRHLDYFIIWADQRDPSAEVGYFILQTGSADWEDEPREEYHFQKGNPGSRQIREVGEAWFVYLEDDEFYARGKTSEFRPEERDDGTHYFAQVTDYQEIGPVPVASVESEIEQSLPVERGIIKISKSDFQTIVDSATGGEDYDVELLSDVDGNIWQISPGYTKYELWPNCVETGVIPLGWGKGDLSEKSEREIEKELGKKNRVFAAKAFGHSISSGDIVVAKKGTTKEIYGIGVVDDGHFYDPELAEELFPDNPGHDNFVSVDWIIDFANGTSDPVELPNLEKNFTHPTLADFSLSRYKNLIGEVLRLFPQYQVEFEKIRERSHEMANRGGTIEQAKIDPIRTRLTFPRVSIPLPDHLYFDEPEELRRQIEATINSGKHIIFTGPPGTGKTKLAKEIAKYCSRQYPDYIDDHRFTTATSAWTTFDTIGGYVPRQQTHGDELVFQPRIFLNCFRSTEIRNDWLVIDEINRSDIDKAFGQLFSVLSGDSVELPYERKSPVEVVSLDSDEDEAGLREIVDNEDLFPVTPSWRLLATMNTYDKASLYELSYAFMRRFNFIHVGVPDLENDDGEVRTSLLDPDSNDDSENYATKWIDDDPEFETPLEHSFEQLAILWKKINSARTIGPSIVRDIVAYLAASGIDGSDEIEPLLTDSTISLIYPQLEGMRPQDQRQLIDSLSEDDVVTETGSVDVELEQDRLRKKAEDFFNITFEEDE